MKRGFFSRIIDRLAGETVTAETHRQETERLLDSQSFMVQDLLAESRATESLIKLDAKLRKRRENGVDHD